MRCILVKYEDFKKDKVNFISSLCGALDLPVKKDITLIMDRPFQPKGNTKIAPGEFFGKNIDIIIQLCGKRMEELGYKIPKRINQ